ncbi:type I-F CRISPR-associated protein Csy2 [Agarivorans sp. QJM3NY_33]|uniref:type I-F CRISPR-associated protein Csy2 n=1 Tax=Agarivorans sp. QJM3NY_33 TaxID=3421432 RepID=UPI003D7D4FDB
MESLKELLQSKPDDLNVELKRAFRPLTPHISIDGKELDALTVLVNLTDKTADQKDLLDKVKCKQKLRDEKWWAGCLKTVEYRQSHNLKFPDIRSEGVIRATTLGQLPDFLLSSFKLKPHNWAYSHDSSDVNKSALLTNEFSWNGMISCLGNLLKDAEHPLWQKLSKLGCYQKTRKAIAKKLAQIAQTTIKVSLAPNYLTQLSLPDSESSYISLSPVASQSMQSHCYRALEKEYRYTALTRYSRSTNMGVLPMTCGGTLKMLKAVPNFSLTPHHSQIITGKSWLTQNHIQSLKQYQKYAQYLMPKNKQAAYRRTVKNEIREMVKTWLLTQDHNIDVNTLVEHLNNDLSRFKSAKCFAYEPSITKLLLEIIKGELTESTVVPTNIHRSAEKDSFFAIPNIRVCGASALSSPITVGLPSLTAFLGFTHAFERNLNDSFPRLTINSFAICVHQLQVEKRGLTKEYVQKANHTISPPATHDDWQCDLMFSLVIKLDRSQSVDENIVVRALPKRFARGSAKIAIADFKYIQSFESIEIAIQSLPQKAGKWLSMHTEPVESISDILSAIKEDRRLTPTCVGYHFLEQPTDKSNSLRGYKHAFSECIIGLIETITFDHNTDINTILWHHRCYQNYLSVQPRSTHHGTTD